MKGAVRCAGGRVGQLSPSLDAGEAKDATSGREFQFTSWMRDALERQRKLVSKMEKKTKSVIPWVFCQPDGGRIYRFYEAWREACKAAGIDRIPHDFRRPGTRRGAVGVPVLAGHWQRPPTPTRYLGNC